jgi:hypothetical protein
LFSGDATILEESEKIKIEPSESNINNISIFSNFFFSESSRNNRQLRTRTGNDDEQMEVNPSTDEDNDMYSRAREKHARATEREHRKDVKEEPIIDEILKSTQPSTAVKVRRINDETTQKFDDEQIEMGVGLSGKKNKVEKKEEKKMDTKENDLTLNMPIASEKKRQAEETRIERIQRLCEKRTVGDVLDAAKQAYFERQQKRELFKDYIERIES